MSMNIIRSPYPSGVGGLGPVQEFMLTATIGSTRNNHGNALGFRFTVGASPMTVSELGRWRFSANTESHLVKIVEDAVGFATLASVSIDMSSGTADTFKFAAITPIVLSASTDYILASDEVNGGDIWGDDNMTGITTTGDGMITSSVFQTGPTAWQSNSGGEKSFIPVSFKYQV